MSQENMEVVQAVFEAWQRDDFDAFLSVIHPNIEWHAVLQRLVEAQGLRDVGDDRVLLLVRFQWRGVASGSEMESPVGLVMTLRDGKVIRSFDYLSHQEALEAVGLEE